MYRSGLGVTDAHIDKLEKVMIKSIMRHVSGRNATISSMQRRLHEQLLRGKHILASTDFFSRS
jgi:hypothetical protein